MLPQMSDWVADTLQRGGYFRFIPESEPRAKTDVRLWPNADIRAAIAHVRFTSKSGHVRCN
jgi:hypothetical protein